MNKSNLDYNLILIESPLLTATVQEAVFEILRQFSDKLNTNKTELVVFEQYTKDAASGIAVVGSPNSIGVGLNCKLTNITEIISTELPQKLSSILA